MSAPNWWPRLSPAENVALAMVTLLALALRFHGITSESFWVDEAASWSFSSLSLTELWTQIQRYEPHPPVYYSLLKFWRWLLGDGEAALRSLSALAGTLVVPLTFLIGRIALDRGEGSWIGLCAAAIIAVHPIQIAYSQEVRAYELLTLATTLGLLPMVWWLKNPDALALPMGRQSDSQRIRNFQAVILFVFGSTLSLYMHNTVILLFGVVLGAGAVFITLSAPEPRRALATVVLLAAAILVLWLPGAILLVQSFEMVSAGYWMSSPTLYEVVERVDLLLGSVGTARTARMQALAIVSSGTIALFGMAALFRRGLYGIASLLAVASIAPILVCIAATYLITPIFVPRTLIWTEISFSVLLAASLLWLRPLGTRAAAAAVMVGIMTGISALHTWPKAPWRQIVTLLEQESRSGDRLITWYNYAHTPLQYYRSADRISAAAIKLWPEHQTYPTLNDVFDGDYEFSTDEALTKVQQEEPGADRIWLVTRSPRSDPTFVQLAEYLESARGAPKILVDFIVHGRQDPPVLVLLYGNRLN